MIDLTWPLDDRLLIYADGDYRDPPLARRAWCAIDERGFRVEELRLGTQTGTHIDAPAHFDPAGATLDALPVERLIGSYCLIDLPARPAPIAHDYRGEAMLFVRACGAVTRGGAADAAAPQGSVTRGGGAAVLDPAQFEALLALPPIVWVVAGVIEIDDAPRFEFHRALAHAGRYLVEDLEPAAALEVRPGGELFVLPLALVGTSGAPCRVVVRPVDER